jgi:biopolymer transport protein ExbD
MKFPRNAKIFRGQLEAAPFAGVLFLLVLFLLLNSNLVFRPGIRIQLPEDLDRPVPGVAGPLAVVSMDKNGRLFFESQVIQEPELAARLRAEVNRHKDLTLVIQADKAVQVEAFYRVNKLAVSAGVRNVLLPSRPAPNAQSMP